MTLLSFGLSSVYLVPPFSLSFLSVCFFSEKCGAKAPQHSPKYIKKRGKVQKNTYKAVSQELTKA
jgi:hypothetical protein